MKVSLNIIKQYIDFDLPPIDELVYTINMKLGGVEEVIDLGDVYKDAVIVKVVECEKHPNADKLNVTKIDDGGIVADVPRDENGRVEVVCGAPNVHADMYAVWLPPKSVVPASYHDAEPFVLGARELRGVVSQGMLAASDELGIGNDHGGILEIYQDEWKPSRVDIVPGASFAEVYGLDDTIIDIENKMFTHRPDLFGQLGIAREVAGILRRAFTSPGWYIDTPVFEHAEGLALEAFNDASDKVPRLMFVAMKNIEIKPSPLWLQCALVAMGSKPINNIVDVTNYVMLLTAQPTHDYDKIRGGKIGARMAQDGEMITLLNGKEYELRSDDIVIADAEGAIGLGAIMGGRNSEVSSETKNIILEVANFDMYTVRKSSMYHGLFTDALTRFTKGQSSLQNDHIMNLLMMSVRDVSPNCEQASAVSDLHEIEQLQPIPDEYKDDAFVVENPQIQFMTTYFVNDRLGLNLQAEDVATLLGNVEMKVNEDKFTKQSQAKYGSEDTFSVAPPFWRTDIELPEDIVEEIGRLYGFDKLPRRLPLRSTKPAPHNALRELKQHIRHTFEKAGANEVLSYSFVHKKLIEQAGQDAGNAYRISNALSPDLQYYRTSIMPSLLDKVHMNVKAGHEAFAMYEIGKVHYKGEMDANEPDVPNEDNHIALVISYQEKCAPNGAAYFSAKRYFELLNLNEKFSLIPIEEFDTSGDEWGKQLCAPYAPKRTAVIVSDNQIWGVIGEYRPDVAKKFKLPEASAGFELHLDAIVPKTTSYQPLSRYPSVKRDVTISTVEETSYEDLYKCIEAVNETDDILINIIPLGVYHQNRSDRKNVSFRLIITSFEKTLLSEEVSAIIKQIEQKLEEYGAYIV